MAASTCTRLFAAIAIAALLLGAAGAARAGGAPFKIYYAGSESLVLDRLEIDPDTSRTPDLDAASTAVFQDAIPSDAAELDTLKHRVEAGAGLLVVLGPSTDSDGLSVLTGGAVKTSGKVDAPAGPAHARESERIAAVIEYVGPANTNLARDVNWKSAVRVHERSLVEARAGATVLVATSDRDPVKARTPVLIDVPMGKGHVVVLNVWLRAGDQRKRIASVLTMLKGIEGAQNYDFQRWPYFNWLVYDLAHYAAGADALRYGDWRGSPIPDAAQVTALIALFGAMMTAFVVAYVWTRRYSLAHPELLDRFYKHSSTPTPRPQSLGAAAAPISAQADAEPTRGDPRWEKIGFHRPLSGFFYNYLLALLIMIPFNFVFTFYIERNFVNPFLEARGAWALVTQTMVFFFTLLDLGTSQAMVKYFAEYRVTEPGRAIKFAQFFIWFHALCGMFQIAVLGIGAALIMPHTAVAFLTWFVILHTLIQFPGFIAIFFNLFRALQRFDYSQLLIVLTYVMNPLIQMTCGVYMRRWGLMHPIFGEGMGVVFGFAIGGVIANLLTGLFCAVFYDRMGFNLATIFLAHFDRDTVRKSIIYGVKLTGGSVAITMSWALLPVIMGALLPNYLELNEIWILTFTLSFAYLETGTYIYTTLMPSISESYSQGMIVLTRRYLDQGLRWGMIITSMLGGAFVAFSDVFMRGLLPPQFARAASVMILMHLWRATDFFTRLPDQVFQGVGRTGTFTWTAILEHASRVALLWILIGRFGFNGVFYAFMISSILRAIVAWPLMGLLVAWPSLSVWQTLINPSVAAVANYLVLRWLAAAVWQGPGHIGSAWLVILGSLFGSLPIYMFVSGLLGWDDFSLEEFRDAAELVPAPFGAIARMAHRLVAIGSSLSPLHNRFPGNLTLEAADEAARLTALKADLR